MSILAKRAPAALLAAGAVALAVSAAAAAQPADPNGPRCFFVNQWKGSTYPAPDVIYLGVTPNAVYKVQLSVGSPQLGFPDQHLISRVTGSSSICTALDLQLYVSNGHGIEAPLIARSLTRLTPEEVAAIPRKYRPYN